ncbi:probable serine/threonine-protein kinase mkcB isoform X2 [Toxorhynchites rutilus septentrionalis]|uniref:probable serine/threonine-protein kinase mkcB isoform X2 n=1 Tax=Toxorhynchites rutilus septentrionalis TaxID=329112 RepID=UPI00247A0B7F|nr:probable serine/threonine-protein kinase mkcB isoform X2 [Toxorhynchites rutilus septentrionalis]
MSSFEAPMKSSCFISTTKRKINIHDKIMNYELEASLWDGNKTCCNSCVSHMVDLARCQSLEMDGSALTHNMVPPMENASEGHLVPEAERKCGSLDVDLDRKFLNNNNTTSITCLQFITPPDPPPSPALLLDYVVESSIKSQPPHTLLDSEIKRFENLSFNSNSDKQSTHSQVDAVETNSPRINTRPVVVTEDVDAKETTMSTTGIETAKQSVNCIVTNASTNRTSDQKTTKSSPVVTTPTIVTTTPENPFIEFSINIHCSTVHHSNHKHHPMTVPPAQKSGDVNASTSLDAACDICRPKPSPPLPSMINEYPTNTKLACKITEAYAVSATDTTTIDIASAAAYASKPPIHNKNHLHHQYQPHHVTPFSRNQTCTNLNNTSSHSLRFMTQHIKILPKTQSLDLVDNDDLLEASNRSESQLEINTTGVSSLKGRVLPKLQPLDQTRPIYPNVPYSPYNSPYGSPRSGRRRTPLRESRRVSIEQTGSFLQLNQYKLLDQIGQGSYGLVKLAYSEEDSTHYAMKILSKRKLLRKAGLMRRGPKRGTSPLDRVYREIAVLKKLDHPNVVKLIEVLDDPLEDSLYLVFELVQHGEVLAIPTDCPLSEGRAWNIFRDVLLGVEYLHYQRIIHGDLKPANLLLSDSGSVKVADLGVCNEFLGEDAAMNNGSTAGTPAFRSPETLLPGQHVYNGKAADIWALGATLYSLVHGKVPFIATSVPGVYEKIKNDPLQFPPTSPISPELRDLIETMLDKDPQLRITLPQIKEHCWVTKFGTQPLPSEEENCRLVQINDEDMTTVVKSIPKGISGRAPQLGGSRIERFGRSGRSNSAPGDYHTSERQPSNESLLPSVTEGISSPSESPEQLSPCHAPSVISTPSQDSIEPVATETDEAAAAVTQADSGQTNMPNPACLEVLL